MTKTEKILRFVFFILLGITYCFFIRRLFFGINTSDEIFNITNSFRLISGNRLLVDLWDYYQTGDVFLAPFIWVFWKISGSLEGIVLACRLFYAVINLGLAVMAYHVLRDYLKNFYARIAVCSGIVFFAPFSLYYLYYDTSAQIFLLLGVLLLLKQLKSDSFIPGVLAGVAHGCMVFAYPTSIILVLVEIIAFYFLTKRERMKKKVLFYLFGGFFVICLFVIYAFTIKFDFFFWDNPISRANQLEDTIVMSSAEGLDKINMVLSGESGSIVGKLLKSLQNTWSILKMPILAGAGGLTLLFLARRLKVAWLYWGLYFLLLFVPIILFKRFASEENRAVILMYVFYSFLLLCALIIRIDFWREKKELLLLGVLPSIAFVLVIGVTAAHGGTKPMVGLFLAGVLGFGIGVEAIKIEKHIIQECICPIIVVLMAGITVALFYGQFFQDKDSFQKLTLKVDRGVYRGLIASEKDRNDIALEQELSKLVNDMDKSAVLIGSKSCYNNLTIGKKIMVPYVGAEYSYLNEEDVYYLSLKTYWERFGYPDVLIACNNSAELFDEEMILSTPDCNFRLREVSEHFRVYENK